MLGVEFTEEEYQNIIKNFNFARGNLSQRLNTVLEKFYEEFPMRLRDGMDDLIIMAFINPVTRNDAHEKFVEKEKKYVWTSKKANSSGRHKRLFWQMSAKAVQDYFTNDENAFDNSEFLTESEIEAWGYNSEMFNKEEV